MQRLEKFAVRADELIKQMNMEANSIPKPDVKERLKQRVKTFQSDIIDLKKQIKESKDSTRINMSNAGRDYLLGSGQGEATNSLMTSDDYRRRMEGNTKMLQSSGAVIDQ